jgi:hypothetical protein
VVVGTCKRLQTGVSFFDQEPSTRFEGVNHRGQGFGPLRDVDEYKSSVDEVE